MPNTTQQNIKKKILLVEDETDIRLLYAEILIDAGYEVIQAEDGKEGQKMIMEQDWDLLLLDVILPEQDGMEILRRLKGSPFINKGPIIILTNLKNERVIKESKKLGASGYIVKSDITPERIIKEVESRLK